MKKLVFILFVFVSGLANAQTLSPKIVGKTFESQTFADFGIDLTFNANGTVVATFFDIGEGGVVSSMVVGTYKIADEKVVVKLEEDSCVFIFLTKREAIPKEFKHPEMYIQTLPGLIPEHPVYNESNSDWRGCYYTEKK